MPALNGTGPWGAGPMTGRGLGWCRWPNNFWFRYRFRRGWGHGFGRGWRWRWFYPYWVTPYRLSKDEEIHMLKEEAEYLKDALNKINSRLSELEKEVEK